MMDILKIKQLKYLSDLKISIPVFLEAMEKYVVRSFALEEEYKKPTDITPEDISRLRQWLHTQPHLPEKYITDLDLILALHSSKRCIETTKKLIDTHYTMKTKFTAIFKDFIINDKIELALNRILLKPLPTRTKDGDAILYTRLLHTDVKNYMALETFRSIIMVLELWQYEEGTWPGLVIVYDLTGLNFGHVWKIEMDAIKQFLTFLQEATFIKIRGIHLLNTPYFMHYFITFVKKFIKNEIVEAFKVHQKGSQTLEKYVDVAALPKEAGGNYKTFEECKEEMLLKMIVNKEFFVMENKKRVDECLRPDTSKERHSEKTT